MVKQAILDANAGLGGQPLEGAVAEAQQEFSVAAKQEETLAEQAGLVAEIAQERGLSRAEREQEQEQTR